MTNITKLTGVKTYVIDKISQTDWRSIGFNNQFCLFKIGVENKLKFLNCKRKTLNYWMLDDK